MPPAQVSTMKPSPRTIISSPCGQKAMLTAAMKKTAVRTPYDTRRVLAATSPAPTHATTPGPGGLR